MLRQHHATERPKQAQFIRESLLSLIGDHADQGALSDENLQRLLKETNAFLEDNAVDPIELPDVLAVNPAFGEALVKFFNEINHYSNPLNERGFPSDANARDAANLAFSRLYQGVSDYLHNTHVPIRRKGIELEPETTAEPTIKLWRRHVTQQADGSYTSHVEEVDRIDTSLKSVICVGGTASIHGHLPSINGLMKVAETKLGGPEIHDEGVALYCVSYPKAHRPSFFADTHHYNADPEHYYSDSAKAFANSLVMPAIDALPEPNPELLKEAFANINLFAYSYGTVFVQEVRNYLSQQLLERGYKAADIRDIFAEVYAMNIGPTCRLDAVKETGNFSSVYVLSPHDLNVRSRTHNHVFLNALTTSGKRMKPLSENELLIYSDAPLEASFIDYDNPEPETPPTPPTSQDMRQNPSRHDLKFYVEATLQGNGEAHIPRYLSYLLSEAVGTKGAYKELDERFLPACHPVTEEGLRIGSRLVRDVYQLQLLEEITRPETTRRR